MDSIHYPVYADSAPRTPSPHAMPPHFAFKHSDQPLEPRIYDPDPADDAYWSPPQQSFPAPAFTPRGSLLQELYDHEVAEQQQPQYDTPYDAQPQYDYHPHHRPHEYAMVRRNTFPYVRHDRDDLVLHQYPPFIHHQHEFIPDFDDNTPIKLEDNSPHMVPSQQSFFRPPSAPIHNINMSYVSPHTGLPVQHTDDAASKETQYLRRRCFNCHTTEPPSWRRSTLNPGKIVCNKCGLYERTHLRPRPLRFDELRAGNKARTSKSKGTVSPKAKISLVKKEPREFGLVRRSSVSSSSSVHSGSGASDWDDNVSVYSNGSAPPTSFNSPNVATFPLSRDSQSPPHDGGIRLPNAPLSDLAVAMNPHHTSIPPSPRKSHTAPLPSQFYPSPPSTSAGTVNGGDYYNPTISIGEGQESGWPPVTASPQSTIELALPADTAVTASPALVTVAIPAA
ncbi:hypothetical protein DXG03_000088 [Asterophora parasitica]|uniref:GATA-type domain-containing protein n=1 Tax=Asterophora parasitica TaxID=117018 RepID=A0A9P7GF00_9AGAR|nr:hypothetical protein DXG03_000088 [Asterophora parasitica]